ncbi:MULTISPECIES: hypothetical protein [Rhizobium]|uniref:Uncharacterized protein n=1 Tax=Rhizobium phaseoli TaxID=396 RepID=A0A7X6J0C8_9HYPH|nr:MULTISPECIES: hypothetical protein [Rhizobium]MDE8757567.1 hypothetical protein [Rhizobium sp. CBK13]NKF11330.1 hypothetical protein [Rhizobium phaseoli]QPK12578.1 hypothetical protein HER27_031830 [Rhizobium phaseoli]
MSKRRVRQTPKNTFWENIDDADPDQVRRSEGYGQKHLIVGHRRISFLLLKGNEPSTLKLRNELIT